MTFVVESLRPMGERCLVSLASETDAVASILLRDPAGLRVGAVVDFVVRDCCDATVCPRCGEAVCVCV